MSKENKIVMTRSGAKRLLSEEDTGYLCLSSRKGKPYGVPVSYAFMGGRIVFHCALKGRKLDLIRENPAVCFTVSRHPDRVKPHHPEKGCKYRYESVICFGRARIIENLKERHLLLNRFLSHFNVRLGRAPKDNFIPEAVAKGVGCVAIDVNSITGRMKTGKK
ncbi:MAG: pyridoxamine 5'-phosphate oxidase family protein [Elusimicrobia bacterium]|nr:pyridoxamine 5'-phosphate oxidase family protein [Elusimicrobiota bacterium]